MFQSVVTTPLHLNLLRRRDGLTKLLVGIQPQCVAREHRGRIAPLLDRRIRPRAFSNLAADLQHDAVSDLCDAACELGAAEAGQGSWEATSGRREASSLRDRAAAARKAFNRADALVAMAEGYLRGDRPERAPIEVVLTIPASSLRAGATLDPVEVGEMGESFLSSE
ncbi:MAG TPA: hypothetical protein VHT91_40125, partial [Kofleriaceae bacterium]|nr:hypothetical protein [Kofleriaceae bacterium]